MTLKLLASTRLGLQAALAIALASLVGHLFPTERSYWAIATAMLLISQTWGESVKKSIDRVAMTVAGGIVGTLIYLSIKDYNFAIEILLLSSAFFIIYFIDYSYLITIFFVTIWVVFLFAKIKIWNIHLLIDRIYETFLGASIAIFVSAVFFPVKAKDIFFEKILIIIQLTEKSLQSSFAYLHKEHENLEALTAQHNEVAVALAILQKSYKLSRYEHVIGKKKLNSIVKNLSMLVHYLTSVLQATRAIRNSNELNTIKENILSLESVLSNNLHYLYGSLSNNKNIMVWQDCPQLNSIQHAVYTMDKTDYKTWLSLNSLFYFLANMSKVLAEFKNTLEKC